MKTLPKILIIEDEPIVLKALSGYLLQEYDVIVAKDGKEGLAMIQSQHPNVVLLDLILPKMHGFEVLKKVKSNPVTSHMPVIILSNVTSLENIDKSYHLGACDYLIKEQVNFEIIRYKIEVALSGGKVREQPKATIAIAS